MHKAIFAIAALCLFAAGAAALTVETDRPFYFVGNTVMVTITNDGVGPVDLVSWPPFCPYHVESGTYPECTGLPVITTLQPGESTACGHDTGVRPDSPGHYIIQVLDGYTIYELLQPIDDEPSAWGALKTLYR
jgi:hypothetical protein